MAKISEIKNIINQAAKNIASYNVDNTVKIAETKVNEPVIKLTEPNKQQPKEVITLKDFIKTMEPQKDYGTIPGIPGNCLFKRGALKILRFLCCTYDFELLDKTVDTANNLYSYTIKVKIINREGLVVSTAIGAANSKEKKFIKAAYDAENNIANMAMKRAIVAGTKNLL